MLFKDNKREQFAMGLAEEVVRLSCNSGHALFILWDAIAHNFYKIDLKNLVDLIEYNLSQENFPDAFKKFSGATFSKYKESQQHYQLSCSFYDYYFSRLPVLFSKKINHRGQKLRLHKREKEYLSRKCFIEWKCSFPKSITENYTFSGQYREFSRINRFYNSRKKIDDKVYDMKWIESAIDKFIPDIYTNNNTWELFYLVLESSFPMFWDKLQSRYGYSMMASGTMGSFSGDEEL